MNERKKLKKQLGNKYIFKMYLSVNEVKKLLSENPKDKHDTLFASLTVGCVKINAVVFPTPDKMLLGFDILVKDTPESEEWICYDTLSDEIRLSPRSIEQSMFDILNREVKWTDYLTKCVMVFQKNRGLKQDGYVGLITTYYLLKD